MTTMKWNTSCQVMFLKCQSQNKLATTVPAWNFLVSQISLSLPCPPPSLPQLPCHTYPLTAFSFVYCSSSPNFPLKHTRTQSSSYLDVISSQSSHTTHLLYIYNFIKHSTHFFFASFIVFLRMSKQQQQRQYNDANFVVEDKNDPHRVFGYRGT